MNLKHFIRRAQGSGDVQENVTEQQFRKLLTDRINSIDMEKVKADAVRFVPDSTKLNVWSKTYFADLAGHLKIN
jgi:hypothetical protein